MSIWHLESHHSDHSGQNPVIVVQRKVRYVRTPMDHVFHFVLEVVSETISEVVNFKIFGGSMPQHSRRFGMLIIMHIPYIQSIYIYI